MDHSLPQEMHDMTTTEMSTSARRWGALWGDRPRAWAISEEQQTRTYEAALRRVRIGGGERVLDVGCATGVFLRMCADRGAVVSGLDAAESLLALARERVPEADLRLGDLESLPYGDDTFDVVTGFTSFFFADDIVAALREAGRVARPGAPVVVQVFGRPEHCALEAMKEAVALFRPAPPPDAPREQYWRPGVVEELAPLAGLDVERSFDTTWAYSYASDDALTDAMLAAGGAGAVAGPEREPEMRAAILRGLAGCRQPDGSYSVANEWRTVIARAGRDGNGRLGR
jgi:ubiquinone/menaquinone biosynthesis C-methylase UbiE